MPEADLPDAFLPSPGESAPPPPVRRESDVPPVPPEALLPASRNPDPGMTNTAFLPPPPAPKEIPAPAFSHEGPTSPTRKP